MAEQRLIDANALIDGMKKRCNSLIKEYGSLDHYADGFTEAINYVENAPTVDAVEVVHGRWEVLSEADYKCSRCGFRFTSADPISMFQYCRCGAKMDGDGE